MARYGKKASTKVEKAMHERKRGQLKSGRSGKTVKSRKQAIAIGLSEARKAGAKVPKKRPKLCAKTIRERDSNRCQYTGKLLRPDEGSLDHVLPRSRGGKDEWGNLVWSDKAVNARKGNRLPHEAGLHLMRKPKAPSPLPVSATVREIRHPDWRHFLHL